MSSIPAHSLPVDTSVTSSSTAVALVSSTLPPFSPQASTSPCVTETSSSEAMTSSFPTNSNSALPIAVPLALSAVLFVSLVATIIMLVCVRLKHRKKETVITILEEELRER